MKIQRIQIGTHDGVFHADDVFAVAIATEFFVQTRGDDIIIDVVRSRDEEKLNSCNMIFDVGGKYDGNRWFDHHQRGFDETRDGVPFAASGLAWRALGKTLCGGDQVVADAVDRQLIQSVDAADNGQALVEDGQPVFEHARSVSLSAAIAAFNPGWQEDQSASAFDSAFAKAVQFARCILRGFVKKALGAKAARHLLLDAEQRRLQRNDHTIILDQYVPWRELVSHVGDNAYYVVYPGSSGNWMLQCVPPSAGSFAQRVPLPTKWAGLREAELREVTGISGAEFCHPGRFIAGATSKGAALELAEAALELQLQDEHAAAAALSATIKNVADQAG